MDVIRVSLGLAELTRMVLHCCLIAGLTTSAAETFAEAGISDLSQPVNSNEGFQHGFSFFGTLAYPPDFEHFDYVNPDAPIGGDLALPVIGTFNSFTPFIQKGIDPAGYAFVGEGIFLYDRLL